MIADIDANLVEKANYRADVERMVLSQAMLDAEALLDHLTHLEARDVHDPILRRLFELVGAMQRNREPITSQSITLACCRAGIIEALGAGDSAKGRDELDKLLATAPNVAHVEYYCKELKRLAISDRAFQSVYDSAIRLSHKNCNVDSELQFLQSLNAKESLAEDSLVDCDQVLDRLSQSTTSSRCRIKFGIPTLDAFVTGGLDCKWLVLLGARFGRGKSALACQLFSNAVQDGRSAVMFSLEMTREEIFQRVCSNEMGIPMTAWRKDQRPKDLNRLIADFRQRTKGRKWWIDDQASQTIDSIRFACESLKFKEGLDLIIIDNLQLIRSELDARQPRDVHYTAMSKALKVMAKKLDCVIVLLCQLDTEAATKRPTSANWASAKAIEGDANVALMIHSFVEREGDEPQFEIIGTKIRDGKPGFIPIRFDGLHQRFESEPVGEFAGDFQ